MKCLKSSIEYVKNYNEWRRGAEKERKRSSGEDWLPIETAKNNGSEPFLAYISGHGQCVCFKSFDFVFNASKKNGRIIKAATHYKPLDPPPCDLSPQEGKKVFKP